MSIEIGQKYIGKDGEVVEIFKITTVATHDEIIFFTCKKGINHVLFDYDFLEQYKPYEPVYEFEYRLQYEDGSRGETSHMTEDEFKIRLHESDIKFFQRLDFTKRERK